MTHRGKNPHDTPSADPPVARDYRRPGHPQVMHQLTSEKQHATLLAKGWTFIEPEAEPEPEPAAAAPSRGRGRGRS